VKRRIEPRDLIRPDLLDMPGYVPITPTDVLAARYRIRPEDVIKVDGNENPYGPSPQALAAVANERNYHIYPDPDQTAVRSALAQHLDVDADTIVCGLGSDDLIDLILRAVIAPGDGVVNCPPTFGMYPFSTRVAGGRTIDISRLENFELDIDAIERASAEAKLIFLASPNNPTGNRASREEIERLLALSVLVVVDEAYIEFAGSEHSLVPMVAERPNLVVLRTFSKWAGLAGLRAGYGVMAPELSALLMTIKQPYNLNVAAGVAMRASLEDKALLMDRVCAMRATRARLFRLLDEIAWVTPYPSEANFILCRLDGLDAVEVQAQLAKRGIFVRYFDTPMLRNCLRISVGLEEHCQPVVSALREIGVELGR
jgi:histidinol-phosphate aminotransferase